MKQVEILSYRPYQRNTLCGFCEISFLCLQIRDCSHHRKDDQEWISLPNKSYQDDRGNTKYYPLIQFADKDDHWKFQDAAKDALKRYFAKENSTGTDDEVPF